MNNNYYNRIRNPVTEALLPSINLETGMKKMKSKATNDSDNLFLLMNQKFDLLHSPHMPPPGFALLSSLNINIQLFTF